MTFSSKTQRALTSPPLLLFTVAIAVGVTFIWNIFRKNAEK